MESGEIEGCDPAHNTRRLLMSFKSTTRQVLEDKRPEAVLNLRVMIAFVLALGILGMMGCKTGSEGGSSNSGGSGGSGSSAGSGGAGGGSSAGDFEGVIISTLASEGKAVPVTYYIRADRIRTETAMPEHPESPFITITDVSKGESTTMFPAQKAYMTFSLEEMMKAVGQDEERQFPKLTATGQKETIAGYTCEHYSMGDQQNSQRNTDMCVAKGLGFFGMGGSSGKGGGMMFSSKMKEKAAANPEWSKFLEGGAFPLKMTTTEGGKTTMTSEVTSIERKKLDDALFKVPADYKEMDVPGSIPMPSIPVPKKGGQ
jgi:hypothetical protein